MSDKKSVELKDNSSSIKSLLNPEPTKEQDDKKPNKRQSLRIKSHEVTPTTKAKRKRITPEQFRRLSDLFERTDTPSYELREKVARELKMTNREVQVWFQNRRAKANRTRMQEQQNQLLIRRQETMFIYPSYPQPSTPTTPQSGAFSHYAPHRPHQHSDQLAPSHEAALSDHYIKSSSWEDKPSRLYLHYPPHTQDQQPSPCDSHASFSSTGSSSSVVSTPTFPSCMTPIDILATAAEYVQRCDEEQRETERAEKRRRKDDSENIATTDRPQCWRPWL
ncbi:Mix paired-like homeobox [Apophysomyces sp. BC1034]|nr:Mix paired-like homeobox [Apophysomyces sp. BC1015]KAG0170601.1 Mix paired-like homeobox [Apophysomyces sp. BC1021]KAG0186124.1 Mix paired-like homeobox [Apophysomyces sp. BC1034]